MREGIMGYVIILAFSALFGVFLYGAAVQGIPNEFDKIVGSYIIEAAFLLFVALVGKEAKVSVSPLLVLSAFILAAYQSPVCHLAAILSGVMIYYEVKRRWKG